MACLALLLYKLYCWKGQFSPFYQNTCLSYHIIFRVPFSVPFLQRPRVPYFVPLTYVKQPLDHSCWTDLFNSPPRRLPLASYHFIFRVHFCVSFLQRPCVPCHVPLTYIKHHETILAVYLSRSRRQPLSSYHPQSPFFPITLVSALCAETWLVPLTYIKYP